MISTNCGCSPTNGSCAEHKAQSELVGSVADTVSEADEAVLGMNTFSPVWAEYDSAAEWCAKRGLSGAIGDPLPDLLSAECQALIDDDPEAFKNRVQVTAYALAMEGRI